MNFDGRSLVRRRVAQSDLRQLNTMKAACVPRA
jgi:hypothetical protein